MLVNHCAQTYAGPGKPVKHATIGRIDDEFNIGLNPKMLESSQPVECIRLNTYGNPQLLYKVFKCDYSLSVCIVPTSTNKNQFNRTTSVRR